MGGLEDAVAGYVVDVGAGRDSDASHLGRQRVGDVVAVEVHGGDHVEGGRAGEHLLQGYVGDGVLHQDLVAGVAAAVLPGHGHVRELLAYQLVAPTPEGALGELHDVALVHPVDPLAAAAQRVVEGGPLQPLRPELRHRLDPHAGVGPDLPAEGVVQQLDEPGRVGRARRHLQAGVDVLGVLPEDHHVDQMRLPHRRGHALEPPHRAQAHVEVHDLADGDVEASEAAAHRCGQRALDADEMLIEGGDGVGRQPVPGLVVGLLAGQHLEPGDAAAVLGRGRVEHGPGGGPDVDADPVALHERDDRLVGHAEDAVGTQSDLLSHVYRGYRPPVGARSVD